MSDDEIRALKQRFLGLDWCDAEAVNRINELCEEVLRLRAALRERDAALRYAEEERKALAAILKDYQSVTYLADPEPTPWIGAHSGERIVRTDKLLPFARSVQRENESLRADLARHRAVERFIFGGMGAQLADHELDGPCSCDECKCSRACRAILGAAMEGRLGDLPEHVLAYEGAREEKE